MEEMNPIRFADQTWLNTHPEVQEVGDATKVGTVAYIAAIKKVARLFPDVKEGDQIEWTAELRGRITVTKEMIRGATEELMR